MRAMIPPPLPQIGGQKAHRAPPHKKKIRHPHQTASYTTKCCFVLPMLQERACPFFFLHSQTPRSWAAIVSQTPRQLFRLAACEPSGVQLLVCLFQAPPPPPRNRGFTSGLPFSQTTNKIQKHSAAAVFCGSDLTLTCYTYQGRNCHAQLSQHAMGEPRSELMPG